MHHKCQRSCSWCPSCCHLQLSIDEEQMMLPTSAEDGQLSNRRAKLPSREAADQDMLTSLQPLQQPLEISGSMLQEHQMGQMWSSEAYEGDRGKPASAEMETEVSSSIVSRS